MQVFCAKVSVLRNWWKRFKETFFRLGHSVGPATGRPACSLFSGCFFIIFVSSYFSSHWGQLLFFVQCHTLDCFIFRLFFFSLSIAFFVSWGLIPPPLSLFLVCLRAFSSTKTGPKSGEITYFEATSKLGNSRFNSLVLLGIPGVTC